MPRGPERRRKMQELTADPDTDMKEGKHFKRKEDPHQINYTIIRKKFLDFSSCEDSRLPTPG